MSTKALLNEYTNVLNKLIEQGPSDELLFERNCLDEAMEHYRLRHQYEQARIAYLIHREFSDSEPPLMERDIAHLHEAAAVSREIAKLLRKRKNGRIGAGAPRDVADRPSHH